LLRLLIVDLDSSFEVIAKAFSAGFQRLLQRARPRPVEAADGEVQAFQGGLLVGEVAARPDRAAEACVQFSIALIE
jgi:hypothetical protein